MDFVERWFGISPDGGSGSFELSVILATLLVVGALIFRRRFHGALAKRFGNIAWMK